MLLTSMVGKIKVSHWWENRAVIRSPIMGGVGMMGYGMGRGRMVVEE